MPADSNNTPKIKVRKPDGTFVEMPLDEFEKTMASQAQASGSGRVADLEDEESEELSIEEIIGAPVMKPEGDLKKVPTIVVRRPDGSYAKITLAEFEMQKNSAAKVVDPVELKKAEAEIDRTPAVPADKKYSNKPKEEKIVPKVEAPPVNVKVQVSLNDQRNRESQRVAEEISEMASKRAMDKEFAEAEASSAAVSTSAKNDQNIGIKAQVDKKEPQVVREESIKVVQMESPKTLSDEELKKIGEAVAEATRKQVVEAQKPVQVQSLSPQDDSTALRDDGASKPEPKVSMISPKSVGIGRPDAAMAVRDPVAAAKPHREMSVEDTDKLADAIVQKQKIAAEKINDVVNVEADKIAEAIVRKQVVIQTVPAQAIKSVGTDRDLSVHDLSVSQAKVVQVQPKVDVKPEVKAKVVYVQEEDKDNRINLDDEIKPVAKPLEVEVAVRPVVKITEPIVAEKISAPIPVSAPKKEKIVEPIKVVSELKQKEPEIVVKKIVVEQKPKVEPERIFVEPEKVMATKSAVQLPPPGKDEIAEPIRPLASVGRESQVDEILKSLSWKPTLNVNRLRTIIQLFLKDVRGEAETIELLRRAELEGGAGLSAPQAAEIVEKAGQSIKKPTEIADVPVLKNPLAKPVLLLEDENDRLEREVPARVENQEIRNKKQEISELSKVVPVRVQPVAPVVTVKEVVPVAKVVSTITAPVGEKQNEETRNKKQETNEKPVAKVESVQVKSELQKLEVERKPTSPYPLPKGESGDRRPTAPIFEKEFKINESIRPTMKDVVRAAPVEVGPIDEIREFSLTDFRRLSADAADAGRKLRAKFANLREESIMMYIEATTAWRISPFYNDYIAMVGESLVTSRSLAAISSDKERIQMPELVAILALEKEIN